MLLLYLTFGFHLFFHSFYLHSTMLLLYRHDPDGSFLTFGNLHSTMLLLYLVSWDGTTESNDIFTFHYASTLSRDRFIWFGSVPHLHSTMLLLYQREIAVHVDGVIIYIPLCFYFILHHRPD